MEIVPIQEAHIDAIRQWRNAQMDVLRQSVELSEDCQSAYYQRHVWPEMDEPHPPRILFSIFWSGVHIGYGGLVHIAWSDARAEVSFLLDPSHADDLECYADRFSRFLALVKSVAFGTLGLHRLFTETYAHRTHHIGVLESSGFSIEGRLRHHVRIRERPTDSLIQGCLSDDDI